MKFSIPFHSNYEKLDEYFDVVIMPNRSVVHSVFLPLPAAIAGCARPLKHLFSLPEIEQGIRRFADAGIETWGLLNASWLPLTAYTNESISVMVRSLQRLQAAGLTGVTLQTNYLLAAGAFTHLPGLKIQASVNQMIDSEIKALTLLDYLPYDALVWCRNFNLDPAGMKSADKALKTKHPHLKTTVLVNEGCLPYCPFKREHDQIVSMLTVSDPDVMHYNQACFAQYPNLSNTIDCMNILMGCCKLYADRPELITTSPVILPENLSEFAAQTGVDIYKIAGRNHPVEWIANAISLYKTGTKDPTRRYIDCI